MAVETILQNEIAVKFIYPFFLIFLVVYALIEKTKILGDLNKQVNAVLSGVIALIFVSVAYPVLILNNLILFLTVAIIVIFVALLLWGFATGESWEEGFGNTAYKKVMIVVVVVAILIAVIWAMGLDNSAIDLLFKQSWSSAFWTNVSFIVAVAVALAVVIRSDSKSK